MTTSPRVVLSGYYGFNNLGDELILYILVQALKARGAQITVLSANPSQTAETYGVESVSRTKLSDILSVFRQAKLFISGGGGLFQDVTGPASPIYYGGLLRIASVLGVKTGYWAQGAGPLKTFLGKTFTAFSLACCEDIIVRDEKSAALLRSLPVKKLNPKVSADPVWLFDPQAYLASKGINASREKSESITRIGISLREWLSLTEEGLKALAIALKGYCDSLNKTVEIALLPFQANEDLELLKHFGDDLRSVGFDGDIQLLTPENALATLCQCDVLFGMRFHSLILGLLAGVRVYGFPYDPKVSTLLEDCGLKGMPVDSLNSIRSEHLIQALDQQYPQIDLTSLKARAQLNLDILDKWLQL
jgi:polysaccharide pyruvyl transferase CsaB